MKKLSCLAVFAIIVALCCGCSFSGTLSLSEGKSFSADVTIDKDGEDCKADAEFSVNAP